MANDSRPRELACYLASHCSLLGTPGETDLHARAVRTLTLKPHYHFGDRGLVTFYSPVLHCAPLATGDGFTYREQYWRRHAFAMLLKCDLLAVLAEPSPFLERTGALATEIAWWLETHPDEPPLGVERQAPGRATGGGGAGASGAGGAGAGATGVAADRERVGADYRVCPLKDLSAFMHELKPHVEARRRAIAQMGLAERHKAGETVADLLAWIALAEERVIEQMNAPDGGDEGESKGGGKGKGG